MFNKKTPSKEGISKLQEFISANVNEGGTPFENLFQSFFWRNPDEKISWKDFIIALVQETEKDQMCITFDYSTPVPVVHFSKKK